MALRPPRSTLFPTRRSSDLAVAEGFATHLRIGRAAGSDDNAVERPRFHFRDARADISRVRPVLAVGDERSEEHTSELQSRRDLVCRLLLEKKKKKKQYKRLK